MKLKVNDQIPDVKIFHLVDGEPKEQNISELLGPKKNNIVWFAWCIYSYML